MTDLKVNADAVISSAKILRTRNNQMRDGAAAVKAAIAKLDSGWDGQAAQHAISDYNKIKNKFFNARYDVLENYTNFLLQQVGAGYDETEKTNKSLADAFK